MLERMIIYRLCNLSRGIRRAATRAILAALDLDLRDWFTLKAVSELGTCPQRDVARHIQMDKVAVNRATRRLKARGLLSQQRNGVDRRSHLLRLTEEGWETLTHTAAAFGAMEREFLGELAIDRNAALDGLLARLEAAMQRLEREVPAAGRQSKRAMAEETRQPELSTAEAILALHEAPSRIESYSLSLSD